MSVIMEISPSAVTPKGSARIGRTLAAVSKCSDSDTLGAVDAPPETAVAEQPAQRPFWQSKPCPSWCQATHSDLGEWGYTDRNHFAILNGIDLSLYDAEGTKDENGEYEFHLPYLGLSAQQHYRDAEPHILLEVPVEDKQQHRTYDIKDVRLTVAEARALRDGLTELLDALG